MSPTMSRAIGKEALHVYMDGVFTGRIIESSQGNQTFEYDPSYIAGNGTPLSLSLNPNDTRGRSKATRAFLWGLLPDNERTLESWATKFGTSSRNVVGLLSHVGIDTAGALQIVPPGVNPTDAGSRAGKVEWFTSSDLSDLIDEIAKHEDDWDGARHDGRWSLAGAQSKVALFHEGNRWGRPLDATPTTHIIKTGIRDYPDHEVNEFVSQRAASHLGIWAAESEIITLDSGRHAYVTRRYDREKVSSGEWRRIHQEDLCQALAVMPSKKYQSDGGPGIGEIADLLERVGSNEDGSVSTAFYCQFAYNALIGATDAHAKNFSLLHAGDQTAMAPLYDTATGLPYYDPYEMKSAMKVGSNWQLTSVTVNDLTKVGERLGLQSEEARHIAQNLKDGIPEAFDRAAKEAPEGVSVAARNIAILVDAHTQGRRTYWGGLDPKSSTPATENPNAATSGIESEVLDFFSEPQTPPALKGQTWVKPHRRTDGTTVSGHWRRPDRR